MRLISLVLVLFTLYTPGVEGAFPASSQKFQREEILVADKYKLLWTVDQFKITLEIQVKTKGWVAFGLSPDGKMINSDIITGWVRDGQTKIQDRFASKRELPSIDGSQDWTVVRGTETDEYTCLTVKRNLRNCDQKDRDIEFDKMFVIYAWAPGEPAADGTALDKHSYKDFKKLNLMENPTVPPLPAGFKQRDFRVNSFTIPSNRKTTYLGQFFAVPQELLSGETHYIVKMEPIITPGNEDLIYHMVLMFCGDVVTANYANKQFVPSYGDVGDQKLNEGIPENVRTGCYGDFIYAWSKGGKAFTMPSDVGLQFGPPELKKVLSIEIHYDNPEGVSGKVDTSGLRLYTVSKAPPNVAGHLYTALNDLSGTGRYGIIPPKLKNFYKYVPCPAQCFSDAMKETNINDIKIFAIFQHANYLASSVRTLHIKKDKSQEPILEEINYRNHNQQIRMLPSPVTIKKGDEIALECGYNSMKQTKTIVAGVRAEEEMCLSFVLYYPTLPKLSTCYSTINITELAIRMGYTDFTFKDDDGSTLDTMKDSDTGEVKTWEEFMKDPETWKKSGRTTALQDGFLNNTYHTISCDGNGAVLDSRRIYRPPQACTGKPEYVKASATVTVSHLSACLFLFSYVLNYITTIM